jgi:hypothetical protein
MALRVDVARSSLMPSLWYKAEKSGCAGDSIMESKVGAVIYNNRNQD